MERSLEIRQHARDPPVRLDDLAIREDVLLREAVARIIIQVQLLGLLAKADVSSRLPSLGTELLEADVFVFVGQLPLPGEGRSRYHVLGQHFVPIADGQSQLLQSAEG